MTKTIIIKVSNPTPNSVMDDGVDYDAVIETRADGFSARVVGTVTYARDQATVGLVPVGDSIDCWMSREIHAEVVAIGERHGDYVRRQVICALMAQGESTIQVGSDHRIYSYINGEPLSGEVSDELAAASLAAAPTGVVLAYRDEFGTWQLANPGTAGAARVWVES